jgi:hypothetical protein
VGFVLLANNADSTAQLTSAPCHSFGLKKKEDFGYLLHMHTNPDDIISQPGKSAKSCVSKRQIGERFFFWKGIMLTHEFHVMLVTSLGLDAWKCFRTLWK